MKLLGHQGDIVIFGIEILPKNLIEDAQTKAGILARGEASGHAHQLDDLDNGQVFKGNNGLLYVDVKRTLKIVHGRARDFTGKEGDHDYHNPVTLDPGLYSIGIVEETDWISKTIRKVID